MSPTYPCWPIFLTIYDANAFIKSACELFFFFFFLFFLSFEEEKKSQTQFVANYLTRPDKC